MADNFPVLQGLLLANTKWSEEVDKADPGFFERSAENQQSPDVLWIGCADSRVPESVITKSLPGVIFVQRNIANQLPLDDINALSVLTYAVHNLGTQHVIIVGHSECGGVTASLKAVQSGGSPDQTIPDYPASHPLNRWLAPLTEFIATLDISSLPFEKALPIAIEANVKRQVEHLSGAAEITNAKKEVWVHGWVYDLATGRLRDLEISRPAGAAV